MEYKHFSHNHTLTLNKLQAGHQAHCHGCNLPCNDTVFACRHCSFFLHHHCGNAGRHLEHPSHPHPLVLVPSPTYCSGSFLCNACGAPGSAFSYCCTLCEVDLHLHCAFLPAKLSHNAHHHELCLSFGGSERLSSGDRRCKICAKELSSEHWSYFCGGDACSFRVHTFCAAGEVRPGLHEDGDQKTGVWEPRVETGLTAEEEIVLEMSRMKMELQMAQSLADIIAYRPF